MFDRTHKLNSEIGIHVQNPKQNQAHREKCSAEHHQQHNIRRHSRSTERRGDSRHLRTRSTSARGSRHGGLEKPEEEQQQQNGGRHGEDKEQLGPGDPRVPGGLAPRRRDLTAVEEPLGPECAPLQLTREGAHARAS